MGHYAELAVWVRRSAIRPVPPYARLPKSSVARVAASCAPGDERARRAVTDGLTRLREAQPELARYLAGRLDEPTDDRAVELGELLVVTVFLAFEGTPNLALRRVAAEEAAAAEAALCADEELRRTDPVDALETEDIVAIEQPALASFVNEHVGATLQRHAGSIDVDDVAAVFRSVLVQVLALSYAVEAPPGYPAGRGVEPMA